MKKLFYAHLFILFILLLGRSYVRAQGCDPVTPVFNVDMTGQPNGTWISPVTQRDGHCCTASGADRCIDFIVTLDPAAHGIIFNIASGAVPPGALYYQVNCGPPVPVGNVICLSGVGPHMITFCKPGNNNNTYSITSVPQPSVGGTQWVSNACTGMLIAQGLQESSITVTSVPYNATYNSYLSCTSGCDTVIVTPTGSFPAYLDYSICGLGAGGCDTIPFCDTIRVNFVNTLAVNITPQNAIICYGASTATVTANAAGGHPAYTYSWSTGATTQAISVGPGTYTVQMTDSMNCSTATDIVTVGAYTLPISANAGNNQLWCTVPGQLNGNIVAAGGGQWFNGGGTYVPNDTTMNAYYSPSAGEIAAGTAHLYLVTTNNLGCPADTDDVVITISSYPAPSISGTSPVCTGQTVVYTTPYVAGHSYTWSVTGGTIITSSANSVTINWPLSGSGTVTVTETNPASCDSTTTITITIAPQPAPAVTGAVNVCTGSSTTYSITTPTAGDIYAWSVTGGTIVGPSNGTSVTIQWTSAGSATVSVNESNSSGCNATTNINVNVHQMPSPVISGTTPVCAGQVAIYSTLFVPGNTYSWSVIGGTIVSMNNNNITVSWPSAGSGTVTVTENNTSTCDSTVTMNILVAPQPNPVITGTSAVCTGTSTVYQITPTAGNTYLWYVLGGSIIGSANGSSVTVQWTSAGSATVSVYESNNSGCDANADFNVNVLQMPAPVIAGTNPVCAGQTVTYTTPYTIGNNYSWNVVGGTVISSSTNNITVYWPAAVTGTVTVTENNTATCDSSVSLSVVVAPQPAPVITGVNAVCTGTSTVYSVATPVAGNTYLWTVIGGMITGANNGTSVNIQWTTTGTATITLYQRNSYGCDSTVVLNVNVLQTPAPNVTGLSTVCAGQTVTYTTAFVTGNSYSWNVTGGNTVAVNFNSITIYWPASGSGSLIVIENNTSTCSATDNINVTIAPQPAPNITGPATVCTGTSSVFNVSVPASGNTYLWNIVGGMIIGSSTSSSVNIQWNTAGTATLTLYESNSAGCDSTVSFNVNVLQTPSPAITGLTPICAGQTASYTTPYLSGNAYTWNVTGGNVVSTNTNTVTISWPSSGTGTITVVENNTATCPASVIMNVTVAPQPAPVISGTATVCTWTSSSYSVTSPTSGNSYAWTVSGGAIIGSSNTPAINVQWSNPGTATISVYESNAYGCDSTSTFTVNVLQTPSPNITGSNHICAGSIEVYTTPLVTGNTYNWTVNGGTVISTSNNTITVLWPNAGSGSVSVTEFNTSACSTPVTYNVNIGAQPAPVINGSTGLCWNANGTYSVATPTSGNNYAWAVTGGTIIGSASATSINVHWTVAGTGTVTLYESNSFGCDSTVVINVTVSPLPSPTLSGVPKTCIQETREYSVPDVQGHTYTWNVTNGSIVGFALGHSIQVYWPNPGNGSVSCRQSNPEGCDSIVAMNVVVDPLPNSLIMGTTTICEFESALYTVSSTAGSNYTWSVTGGSPTSTTAGSYFPVNWNAGGSGSVTLYETDINGCTSQHSFPVVVNAKPHPTLLGDSVGCVSNILNQYTTQSQTGYSYNWSVINGTIISGSGSNHVTVVWTGTGTNNLELTVTNTSTGCDSTVSIPIHVEAMPEPVITTSGAAGCVPIQVAFNPNPNSPSYHYTWSFGDSYTSNSAAPSHDYTNPGTYNVRLIATNNTGCKDTAFTSVSTYPNPTAGFNLSYNNDIYYANMSELYLTNTSSGATEYLWDFGNGDSSDLFQPNYEYVIPGTYTITLTTTNQWGCRDVTTFHIEVKLPEDIFVPSAFTPNGDNKNDFFSAKLNNVTELSVQIFNRWGERIFESNRPDFAWDGTMNGHKVQEDVYVYHIKATGYHGKDLSLIGSVTLAR
jgi:gliding motility-associated-like protein